MNSGSYPEYLSLKELATYSSMSIGTLRKWLDLGMPYFKLGRCIRVKRSDFDKWVERFRVAGTDTDCLSTVWDEVMEEV